jgi:hypothetical protein
MAVDTATRPPELSRRQINVIFGTILLGLLLAALDQTIDRLADHLTDGPATNRQPALAAG